MLLSIITINLNNAAGLHRTISSVVSQAFTDYEFIIIDGGSCDGSVDIIKRFENKITYWISEPDNGIYEAMNKGILKARGEYLQFLNSGDTLLNNGILSRVFNVERTSDILYGHISIISKNGTQVHKMPDSNKISLLFFFVKTISHPSAFIKRELFSDTFYDDSYDIAADKKFFMEKIINGNCTLELIDETLVYFDGGGLSSKPENKNKMRVEENRIISQLFPARIYIDYEFYRSYYLDIQAIVKIKKHKFHYLLFKIVKKLTKIY